MIVRSVQACDAVRWNTFADRHAGSLYHRYDWRELIERAFGRSTYYLAAFRGDEITGILPMVRLKSLAFGDFMVSLPYFNYGGIIGDEASTRMLMDHVIALGQRLGVAHMEFRATPGVEDGCYSGLPARTDKVSMRLALQRDPEALFATFKPKLRSQIRRPQKAGATCRIGGAELVGDFYQVFSRNMRDLGTPVYPSRFPRAIAEGFPEQSKVFVVYLEGQPVASAFVIGHGEMLEIPWASSLRSANSLSVNMLLYWSVLEWACTQGYRTFDFGRSTVDSGTFRFKLQWGAGPVQLPWYYWMRDGGELPHINPDNPRYHLAINVWKRLPLWCANSIGPAIVKNLP